MDRIDRKILDELQRDASIRNNALAARVGLAPSSCLRRVRQLKEAGVIRQVVALTDPEKMGRTVKAVVNVSLADHGIAASREWIAALRREPAVSQIYSVTGTVDVVVVLVLANMKAFQEISRQLFSDNANVIQFQTMFVLEEHKFELAL